MKAFVSRNAPTGRPVRIAVRWLLALAYAVAGILHIVSPGPFLGIMPAFIPYPEAVIFWTGVAEIAGAIGLAQPFNRPLREAAAIGLAAYAICVFPANIQHFALDMARPDRGLRLAYHVPRMILQPVLVWLALWAGEIIRWPLRR